MKIKNVDIPILERHDGTESSGSDTCDSSQNLDVTAGKLNHGVDVSLTPAMVAQYEKTMGMFAAAMTELQMELRDKTNECEALYETARSLSQALQESDLLLQNKTLECERLSLKLQMVTFFELNDDSDPFGYSREDIVDFYSAEIYDSDEYYAVPQRPAAILNQMPPILRSSEGFTRRSSLMKPKAELEQERHSRNASMNFLSGESKMSASPSTSFGPVCVDDCEDDDDNVSATSESVSIKSSYPVCVDDDSVAPEDKCRQTFIRNQSDGGTQVMIGPSQAHFYHIILERDMAKQTNSKLTRDLRYARSKLREFKAKLDKSKSLLELAYDSGKGNICRESQKVPVISIGPKATNVFKTDICNESKISERREPSASSSTRVRSLPWCRNYGIGPNHEMNQDKQDHFSITEYVSIISDEEMLSKKWNRTSTKAMDAALTVKYLNVNLTPEFDVDHPGGSGNLSLSSLLDV
jgi:hypothetical protein